MNDFINGIVREIEERMVEEREDIVQKTMERVKRHVVREAFLSTVGYMPPPKLERKPRSRRFDGDMFERDNGALDVV